MRIYHFGNFYLSSIQQGIQASNAFKQLVAKYRYPNDRTDVNQFLEMGKETILLNGGNNQELLEIKKLMKNNENKFAWSCYHENYDSLGGLLTNVAIIVPNKIYDAAEKIKEGSFEFKNNKLSEVTPYNPNPTFGGGYNPYEDEENTKEEIFNDFEIKLINLISSSSLAI